MSIKRFKDFPDGSGNLSGDDILLFMDNPSGQGTTKKISLNDITNFIGGSGLVESDITNIPGASGIFNIVQISQTDYNNLVTKDPNTLYFIV